MSPSLLFPLCLLALILALAALMATSHTRQAPLYRDIQIYAYLTLTLVGCTFMLLPEPHIIIGLLAGVGGVIGMARLVVAPTRSPEA